MTEEIQLTAVIARPRALSRCANLNRNEEAANAIATALRLNKMDRPWLTALGLLPGLRDV